MNNAKTLMGFAFADLHGGMTTKELNRALVNFTVGQLRENPDVAKTFRGQKLDHFITAVAEESLESVDKRMSPKMWDHMREVYDTEKKFNDACDILTEMGNMSLIIGESVKKIVEKMNALDEAELAASH